MTPGDIRLIGTARLAGQRLKALAPSAEAQNLVDSIDIVLNELILRKDRGFFEDYLLRGCALADAGTALLGKSAMPHAANPADLDDQELDTAIFTVSQQLEDIVIALGADERPAAQDLLDRIVAWEDSLYAYRMTSAEDDGRLPDARAAFSAEAIAAYFAKKRPDWPNLEVVEVAIIPGGFSKITVLFETQDDVNGRQSLAIRAEPPVPFMELEGADIASEFPVVQLVHAADVPVAEPLWLETDTSYFGTRFMLSRKAAGDVHGTVREAGASLPEATGREVASVLARLHDVDYRRYPDLLQASHLGRWAGLAKLPDNTAAFMGYWRERAEISRIGPSPLVRRALDWLARNVPAHAEDDAPVLLHGDIGLHNMLLDEGKVSAILDWEISRIGDRTEDITNFLTATSSVIAPEDFFRWYHEAGGRPVSEYRLRYFDVYHSVKMAICALAVLRRIEENRGAAIALAVFGLQYLHFITSRMTELIRSAEEVGKGTGD